MWSPQANIWHHLHNPKPQMKFCMKATNAQQSFFFFYPCGRNHCAVKCTSGGVGLGWGRGDKRLHEDMVCEWMRAQNEAGPCCAAWGEQRHSADRMETWQTASSTLSLSGEPLFFSIHSSLHSALAASPSTPCAPLPQPSSLPSSSPNPPTLLPSRLLSFPPKRRASPPNPSPTLRLLLSTTLSNSTFPDVCWLLHHGDSQAFCCCHLAFESRACVGHRRLPFNANCSILTARGFIRD